MTFFIYTIYLNWSHTPYTGVQIMNGRMFLLDSPDLNKIGLWLDEYDQVFEPL